MEKGIQKDVFSSNLNPILTKPAPGKGKTRIESEKLKKTR